MVWIPIIYPEGKQISYTVAKKIVLARSVVKKPRLLVLRDPLDQFDEDEAERIMDFLTATLHKAVVYWSWSVSDNKLD